MGILFLSWVPSGLILWWLYCVGLMATISFVYWYGRQYFSFTMLKSIFCNTLHNSFINISFNNELNVVLMCIKIKSLDNFGVYSSSKLVNQIISHRASLVAQWLRICLLMQGTQVRALVWEDPTCRRATTPVSHNYWACASGACAPQQERPR